MVLVIAVLDSESGFDLSVALDAGLLGEVPVEEDGEGVGKLGVETSVGESGSEEEEEEDEDDEEDNDNVCCFCNDLVPDTFGNVLLDDDVGVSAKGSVVKSWLCVGERLEFDPTGVVESNELVSWRNLWIIV